MLTLLTLSLFLNGYYGIIVEHDDIGVIEQLDINSQNSNNETSEQQSLLRRRLVPGGLTNQDKVTILNAHNRYRDLTASGATLRQPSANDMNELLWDPALAEVAQAYSAQCNWAHNSNRASDLINNLDQATFEFTNQQVGENLFLSSGSESINVLLQGIQYWYSEFTYYTYGTTGGTGQCQSGAQCGHYTQLVWANTRYVGCGYTKCPTTKGASIKNGILFVCNYYFAGNVVGYAPYKTGAPATGCASDRSPQGNVCAGCPSRSWDSYCCEYCSPESCARAKAANLLSPPSTCNNGLGNALTSIVRSSSSVTPAPTSAKTTTSSPTSKVVAAGSQSNSRGCCKVNNSRYATFCASIQSEETCNVYSIICAWDKSC